ncbi:MAG: hypothetical protein WDO70_12215 [Alphaproteobacteria bacterium]
MIEKTALFLAIMFLMFPSPAHAGDATAGPWTSCVDRVAGQTQSNPDGFFKCTTTGGTRKWAPQTVVVGEAPTTCDADNKGRIQWNDADATIEMCDGSVWKKILAKGSVGDPTTPPAGSGYFVMTKNGYTGNLGSIYGSDGGDAVCLTDLTDNNWLNKSDAVSRGLLNADHVRAFLCNGFGCAMAVASTPYTFARSGSTTAGGANFTANAWGEGPQNNENWAGVNYFYSAAQYWTGRQHPLPWEGWYSSEIWFEYSVDIGANNGDSQTCGYVFASDDPGDTGRIGDPNHTQETRWGRFYATCDTPEHLLCFVHPSLSDGDSSPPPADTGYFVLSHDTWTGNLNGIAGSDGADAKCLADLTGNDWLNKSDAVSRGLLNADHVRAFICNGDYCAMSQPEAAYTFARSGSTTAGGATFLADEFGQGPGDEIPWSTADRFGYPAEYWSARGHPLDWEGGLPTLWTDWSQEGCCGNAWVNTCGHTGVIPWISDDNEDGGFIGDALTAGPSRWQYGRVGCATPEHLACLVHPGAEDGNPAPPAAGTGYFVMTSGTWTGNLGERAGADAKCLADLTANTWLNKSDANGRGLLDSSHVEAFLCDGDCSWPVPDTTYTFARSGSATAGGATFSANGDGDAPLDNLSWTTGDHFGLPAQYWTGRNGDSQYGGDMFWGNLDMGNGNGEVNGCGIWGVSAPWTSDDSDYYGMTGDPVGMSSNRWSWERASCDTPKHLLCFVHPD